MQTKNTDILGFAPFSDLIMDMPWYVFNVSCAYCSWNVGFKFSLNLGGAGGRWGGGRITIIF